MILPRLCETVPASISCATRACASGSTEPTLMLMFPVSMSFEMRSRPSLVTETIKNPTRTPYLVARSASG